MKGNKEAKISYWAHHLTTIVSVSLVLLLLGIITIVWICADSESKKLKERIELNIVMADSIPTSQTQSLAAELSKKTYAAKVTIISKDEALERWKADTGEDLEKLFGVNPLSEEITVNLKEEYSNPKSIKSISAELEHISGVEGVATPDASLIESINSNISTLTLIMAIIAGVMLIISIVLINNTVHLTIFSLRFSIHTMQLVGATNGYIRRPIIIDNLLAGFLAGIVADILLAGILSAAEPAGFQNALSFIPNIPLAILAGALPIAGILFCSLSALISSNKYLKRDYDQLFH